MRLSILLVMLLITGVASAAPVHYTIDPTHTYPSFAADHMGLSTWRGKFDHTRGTVTLDRARQSGSVHIETRVDSIHFGNPALTKMVQRDTLPASLCKEKCAFFDAAKYPSAVYDGQFTNFVDGAPTRIAGKLTLRGVTKPLDLTIERFQCVPDPMLKPRQRCGADASATLDRAAFGIDAGQAMGMDMQVHLQIQVEAVQDK